MSKQGRVNDVLDEERLRFDSLNIFRFLAALIIVFFHFHIPAALSFRNINLQVPASFFDGPDMVTFFFVLSGFVMTISYYRDHEVDSRFWVNRAARIYPVYIFSLLLAIVASGIYRLDFVLIIDLALLQSWFPQYALEINGPAWALSVQAFFYALFPLILLHIKRRDYDPYSALLASVLFWLFTQAALTVLLNSSLYGDVGSLSHEHIFHFPLPHLCSFMLGISGGYLIIKKRHLLKMPQRYSYRFIVLAISIVLIFGYVGIFQRSAGLRIPVGASFFGPAFLIFILSIAMASSTPAARFLSNPAFAVLGSSSYAIYLLQLPLYTLLYRFVLPLPGLSDGMNLYIFLAAEIAVSILTFYIIERPGKALIKYIFFTKLYRRSRLPEND